MFGNRVFTNPSPAYNPRDTPANDTVNEIEIELMAAQRESVNATRRQKIKPKTIHRHNSKISKFIQFIKTAVQNDPNMLKNGATIDDLVYRLDLEGVSDKKAYETLACKN